MLLPLAAYCLPIPWQYLARVVPTYWPVKVLWLGLAEGGFWAELAPGIVVDLAVLAALLVRITNALRRS